MELNIGALKEEPVVVLSQQKQPSSPATAIAADLGKKEIKSQNSQINHGNPTTEVHSWLGGRSQSDLNNHTLDSDNDDDIDS